MLYDRYLFGTIFHGLVYGMLLFLVASGLTLVFGLMGVLNITHAAFYMLGAYISHTLTFYTGSFWLSLLNKSPKFDNDDDYVDLIMREAVNRTQE